MRLTPTPPDVLELMASHPLRHLCWRRMMLRDHECRGRMTWEHAVTHAGRRVNEPWAIVRLCAWAHSVDQFQDCGGMVKEINEWIAISRIEDWDATEAKYPRTDWRQRIKYLKGRYGDSRIAP